jgi:hypothetical protein
VPQIKGYCCQVVSHKASHATATIFWSTEQPHLSSNHSFPFTRILCSRCSRHLVATRGETGREMAAEFCLSVSLSYFKRSLTRSKILRHGPTASLPLRIKSCYGFLSQLKIHRSEPGLNPRTLGPMESMITITSPRTTCNSLHSNQTHGFIRHVTALNNRTCDSNLNVGVSCQHRQSLQT